jgi:hypothetical protein
MSGIRIMPDRGLTQNGPVGGRVVTKATLAGE